MPVATKLTLECIGQQAQGTSGPSGHTFQGEMDIENATPGHGDVVGYGNLHLRPRADADRETLGKAMDAVKDLESVVASLAAKFETTSSDLDAGLTSFREWSKRATERVLRRLDEQGNKLANQDLMQERMVEMLGRVEAIVKGLRDDPPFPYPEPDSPEPITRAGHDFANGHIFVTYMPRPPSRSPSPGEPLGHLE